MIASPRFCGESQTVHWSRGLLKGPGTDGFTSRYGIVLAQPVAPMAYREFQDSAGLAWKVWDTYPTRPEGMDAVWREGWLTFDCGTARRRLAPVPKGWTEAEPSRLELMCKAAESIVRQTPPRGTDSPRAE